MGDETSLNFNVIGRNIQKLKLSAIDWFWSVGLVGQIIAVVISNSILFFAQLKSKFVAICRFWLVEMVVQIWHACLYGLN